VSPDGTLAYVVGRGTATLRTIVRVDRQGREDPLLGLPPNSYGTISVSPDGTRLAFDGGRQSDIWTYAFARGTTAHVTTHNAVDTGPLWSRDGARLIFSSDREGRPDLFIQNADGTGAASHLLPSGAGPQGALRADSVSTDGKILVIRVVNDAGRADLNAVDLGGERQVRDLIRLPSIESRAALSPDGRWLAYQSNFRRHADAALRRAFCASSSEHPGFRNDAGRTVYPHEVGEHGGERRGDGRRRAELA
jgi:Tol biopolymer transport system component